MTQQNLKFPHLAQQAEPYKFTLGKEVNRFFHAHPRRMHNIFVINAVNGTQIDEYGQGKPLPQLGRDTEKYEIPARIARANRTGMESFDYPSAGVGIGILFVGPATPGTPRLFPAKHAEKERAFEFDNHIANLLHPDMPGNCRGAYRDARAAARHYARFGADDGLIGGAADIRAIQTVFHDGDTGYSAPAIDAVRRMAQAKPGVFSGLTPQALTDVAIEVAFAETPLPEEIARIQAPFAKYSGLLPRVLQGDLAPLRVLGQQTLDEGQKDPTSRSFLLGRRALTTFLDGHVTTPQGNPLLIQNTDEWAGLRKDLAAVGLIADIKDRAAHTAGQRPHSTSYSVIKSTR